MPDRDFKHVSPGEPLEILARDWNAIGDMAREFQRNRRGRTDSTPAHKARIDPQTPATYAVVKWESALAVPEFGVLKYGSPVILPVDNPTSFEVSDLPIWIGETPTANDDLVMILTEPVGQDAYGRAITSGQAVVDIDISDEDHTHGQPIAGNNTRLQSATSGQALILYKPAGTGVKRCIVMLQDVSTAASGNAVPPFAVLTEATGASSWQGREVNIGSGAWSSDGNSGTDNARPFLMDGSTFTPKPTANVLIFEDSGGDLGYLPVQAADRVSGTDYPGYVSTGAQTWNGNKTFGDYVLVNSDAGAGTAFQVLTNYGGSTNFLSTVGGSNPYVVLGGSAPVQLFTYADMHSKRLVVTPAGVGGYVGGAPGQSVVGPGQATLVYPYDPVSYPNTMAFFGASGSAVLMTPSAGILTISSGIDAQTGRFTTWCDAYSYKTIEHGSPFGSYTGGTASDGAGGYYFLNGLYIASSGNPVFSIGGGTTGLTASGTNTITLGGTLALANGGTGTDLSATGPGIPIQGSSGAVLSIFQHSATGETSGFTAGSGTPVNDDSTFTGNVGGTAYNLNDIVKALKGAKLLAD